MKAIKFAWLMLGMGFFLSGFALADHPEGKGEEQSEFGRSMAACAQLDDKEAQEKCRRDLLEKRTQEREEMKQEREEMKEETK